MKRTPRPRDLEKSIVASILNFPPTIKPEGSLPCSQEPANGFRPEPDESCPYSYTSFFELNFNIILPSLHRSSKWCPLFRLLCSLCVNKYYIFVSNVGKIGWCVRYVMALLNCLSKKKKKKKSVMNCGTEIGWACFRGTVLAWMDWGKLRKIVQVVYIW
jgi:hypothetical protein